MKEEVEDAVVEDFHDFEFQDAAEGFIEDLDAGEEVPHRPVTPGASPLVSNFLYVYVYCIVVLFWTFSRVSQRSFCLAGCPHRDSKECGIELAARLTQQGLRPPSWAPAEVLPVGSTTSLASLGLAAVTTLMIGRVRAFIFRAPFSLLF